MLNTEAHAFPRFDASKKRFKTGWARIPRNEKGELILKTEANKEEKKEDVKEETKAEKTEEKTEGKKDDKKDDKKEEKREES